MIQYDPNSETRHATPLEAARKLHAEDIRVGDYVAICDVTYEFASFFWNGIDSFDTTKDQAICIRFTAHDDFDIYRVKSICLPFVYTVDTAKKNRVFDLRRTNLFRITHQFARAFKKGIRQSNKRKRRKKKRARS